MTFHKNQLKFKSKCLNCNGDLIIGDMVLFEYGTGSKHFSCVTRKFYYKLNLEAWR